MLTRIFPSLSQVKSMETLVRHLQLAIDYGTNPVAAEYLAEINRRNALKSDTELEAA
jgi:hypothetical protein